VLSETIIAFVLKISCIQVKRIGSENGYIIKAKILRPIILNVYMLFFNYLKLIY
jgi:hypothetical protein